MIGLSLPETGQPFGWSVASEELTAAIKALTEVYIIADGHAGSPNFPILHACQGVNLLPLRPQVKSTVRNVGWSFCEDNIAVRRYLGNAVFYDHTVCGSSWQADYFKALGLQHISVATQGVNWRLFEIPPRALDDKFIVFSGGKAEYRKGQSMVIAAMRIFMHRHQDVWLNCCWHNPWGDQIAGYQQIVKEFQRLDRSRVIGPIFSPTPHNLMPMVYEVADIGLFPNRCEAGNNMVMSEFMACGRPVIATWETGHKDVLKPGRSLNLLRNSPLTVRGPDGAVTGIWVEPHLDEILASLEFCYYNRDTLRALGEADREYVRQFTWGRCAQEFLRVLEPERLGLDVPTREESAGA